MIEHPGHNTDPLDETAVIRPSCRYGCARLLTAEINNNGLAGGSTNRSHTMTNTRSTTNRTIPSQINLQREAARLAEAILAEQAMGIPYYDSLAAITDPILTPFAQALRSEGYAIKTSRGGCIVTGTCPNCRSRELYTIEKASIQMDICPYCRHQSITSSGALA